MLKKTKHIFSLFFVIIAKDLYSLKSMKFIFIIALRSMDGTQSSSPLITNI